VPERDRLRAETVHAGQHIAVTRRCGDMRAEAMVEHHAPTRKIIRYMRRRQALIAVKAHMIRAKAVDAEEQDVWFFIHCLPPSDLSMAFI